ncbi:gastrula zinc finger protein XlCGF28.1-like [Silurus meridionalis]|nr:gastrula zinc finger protein XlCGF28.1-like [Silurus meridionalis]
MASPGSDTGSKKTFIDLARGRGFMLTDRPSYIQLLNGDSIWRPESSLSHHADPKLVKGVNSQAISIATSVTPLSKMESSRRWSPSGSSAQVTQHASHPVSRAALENLNIQSVDQAEVTQFKQDEDDLLTIAALEEEFKYRIHLNSAFPLDLCSPTISWGSLNETHESAFREKFQSFIVSYMKIYFRREGEKGDGLPAERVSQKVEDRLLEIKVERVSSFKYLGVYISNDLTWTLNTTELVKRAQQWLNFLRRLRKFGMSPKVLTNFYSCTFESVLTNCITMGYGSTAVTGCKRLQRVMKTAEKVTKTSLLSLQSIYYRKAAGELLSSLRNPPTLSTDFSHSLHRAGGTEVKNAELLD